MKKIKKVKESLIFLREQVEMWKQKKIQAVREQKFEEACQYREKEKEILQQIEEMGN